MLRILAATSLPIALAVIAGRGATFGKPQGADEVIALERSALDRWEKGDVGGFLSLYADDIAYFDWSVERRLDGLPAVRGLIEPFAGKFRYDRIEMSNPRVQRSGDIAVLTYNALDLAADGSERRANRANVTEVYRRVAGRWRAIHSHYSYTTPPRAAGHDDRE